MKTIIYDEGTLGVDFHEEEIPEHLVGIAKAYQANIFEALADVDDAYMEKYLAGEPISVTEVQALIRKGTLTGRDRSGSLWIGL